LSVNKKQFDIISIQPVVPEKEGKEGIIQLFAPEKQQNPCILSETFIQFRGFSWLFDIFLN
jgi:hypothetical protein